MKKEVIYWLLCRRCSLELRNKISQVGGIGGGMVVTCLSAKALMTNDSGNND